jgi:hypothetical protein
VKFTVRVAAATIQTGLFCATLLVLGGDQPNVKVLVGLRLNILLFDVHRRLDGIEHMARRANVRDIGPCAIDVVGVAAERDKRQCQWEDIRQSHRVMYLEMEEG